MSDFRLSRSVQVSLKLQDIGRMIDSELRAATGSGQSFALFVFVDGEAQYISNDRDRKAVAANLEKVLANWLSGMGDVPYHKLGGRNGNGH